ncbi:MAG: mechanosensitive ion channel family protein [Myxococcota bacterium]
MPEWLVNELRGTWFSLFYLLVASAVSYGVVRWGLVAFLRGLARRSKVAWDDAFVEAHLLGRLAYLAPALTIYFGIELIPDVPDEVDALVQRVLSAMLVVVLALAFSSFLNALNTVYSLSAEFRHRPIKGYIQVAKLLVILIAGVIVVATLMERSPWFFVSGIGAVAAVMMLVFRDTILALVASIQLASNDMLHIGDWIEMPQAGADGDVIDVALHTVSIQNWDKTISTIPTHRFISESFKNWRGMTTSGGRRLKRAIYLDMNTVGFLTDDQIERFEGWNLLRDYIRGKRQEITEYNAEPGRSSGINADIRRLTNVGTLRAYVEAYLYAHPKIHSSGYTLMVRQLSPGPQGLPIEIYCFSNDQEWIEYEKIQADIFDHILAIVSEFGLRIFQEPVGADFQRPLAGGYAAPAERA